MQFLWSLLPGAREARNDLVVGYAWLIAVGLWIGVPKVETGPAYDLMARAGPVAVAVAVSVVAYLVGSLSGDLSRLIPGLREARAFSLQIDREEFGTDPSVVLEELGDKEERELSRLEATVDRNSAEASFRLSLVPPLVVGGAAGIAHYSWWWALGTALAALALVSQSVIRRRLASNNSAASYFIRRNAQQRAMDKGGIEVDLRGLRESARQLETASSSAPPTAKA